MVSAACPTSLSGMAGQPASLPLLRTTAAATEYTVLRTAATTATVDGCCRTHADSVHAPYSAWYHRQHPFFFPWREGSIADQLGMVSFFLFLFRFLHYQASQPALRPAPTHVITELPYGAAYGVPRTHKARHLQSTQVCAHSLVCAPEKGREEGRKKEGERREAKKKKKNSDVLPPCARIFGNCPFCRVHSP